MSQDLNKMNQTVEDAVKELVTIFMDRAQVSLPNSEDNSLGGNSCNIYLCATLLFKGHIALHMIVCW